MCRCGMVGHRVGSARILGRKRLRRYGAVAADVGQTWRRNLTPPAGLPPQPVAGEDAGGERARWPSGSDQHEVAGGKIGKMPVQNGYLAVVELEDDIGSDVAAEAEDLGDGAEAEGG
jgi:hypothetical protein